MAEITPMPVAKIRRLMQSPSADPPPGETWRYVAQWTRLLRLVRTGMIR
jgi:hypothetical protein